MSTFIAPDGITWIEQIATNNLVNCWSMCYSPVFSKFFAVSYNSYARVLNSTDGITWTPIVKGDAPGQLPKGWKHIIQGNVLVAVGTNGIILSVDGNHWTRPDLPQLDYHTVEYSQELNRFVALTDSNALVFSIDADMNLTQQLVTVPTSNWSSVAYSAALNRFVAVAYRGPVSTMYSTNGITWVGGSLTHNLWNKVIWSPERSQFMAVAGHSIANVGTSTDGINWSTVSNTTNHWRDLAWSPELGMFMMVSSGFGNNNSSTSTGTSFTTYKTRRLSSITWSSEYQMFVANVVQTPTLAPSDLYNVLIGKQITPSPTPTMTVTPTRTVTPTPSVTTSMTPSATITPTPTVTATLTPSITPSRTPGSTAPVTPSVTASVTPSVTITPTLTATPSVTATQTPPVTPSVTATVTPTLTATPSVTATRTPSVTPSITPSLTASPTVTPAVTATPTRTVTPTPSVTPSDSLAPMVNAIRSAAQDWWSFNDNLASNIAGRGNLFGQSPTYEVSPLGGKRLITTTVHSGQQPEVLNTNTFSIGGILRVKDTALSGSVLGGYSNAANGPTVALMYDGTNDYLVWTIRGNNTEVFSLVLTGVPVTQWVTTMLTVATDGIVRLYVNGSLTVGGTLSFTPRISTNMTLNDTPTGRLVGDVDELYTFNRELTAAEINFLQGNGGRTWSPTFG